MNTESCKLTVLDNGIHIVTDYLPHVKSVSFSILNKVGARYETVANNGIAHFIEHMLFNGSKKRDVDRIKNDIADVGGYMNAVTRKESTEYYGKMMAEDAALGFDVAADLFLHPTFPKEHVEKERKVICEEIAIRQDDYNVRFFEKINENMFLNQPLGYSVPGTIDTVNALTRQSLIDFWQEHYHHSDIIIGASGNVDHNAFIDQAADMFRHIKARPQVTPQKAVYHASQVYMPEELDHMVVNISFEGVKLQDCQEMATMLVLKNILGGDASSRLFQEVREKRGYAYSVSAGSHSYADVGIFSLDCDTSPEKVQDAVAVICDVVNQSRTSWQFTEQEIRRAKNNHKASLAFTRETPGGRLDELIGSLKNYGRIMTVEEEMAYVTAVDVNKLNAVAEKIFTSEPIIAATGKVDKMESYDKIRSRLTL